MKPELVTFDCAQTLVRVDWQPSVIAVKSASRAGLDFDRQVAAEVYDRKLRTRWPEFMELNLQRDEGVLAGFWHKLTVDWMQEVGMPTSQADDVVREANAMLFGEGSGVFALYDDVLPCLDSLRSAGFRMAVISNWDNSLHRTLRMFGLDAYFEGRPRTRARCPRLATAQGRRRETNRAVHQRCRFGENTWRRA